MKKIILFVIVLVMWLDGKEFDEIKFVGDDTVILGDFSKSTLLKIIGVSYPSFYKFWQKDPKFESAQIPKFEKKLKLYANSMGYYRAKISSDTNSSTIFLKILKNEPIKIKSIKLDDEFKKLIELKEGAVFQTKNFTNSKNKIIRYLNEKGFAKHSFEAKAFIDIEDYVVDIEYEIEKNQQCFMGKTTIKNATNISEKFIRKKIDYKDGEIFDIRKIETTYEGIYNYGVFGEILIDPNLDKNSSIVPILIEVKEGKNKIFKSFVGFSTDEGIRGGTSWENRNFFGNLKKFEVGVKATQKGYEFYNRYFNPLIDVPILQEISFENRIKYENKRYESYNEKKLENIITFGKNWKKLNHFFGWKLEKNLIDSKMAIYEDDNYFISSAFYRILWDKRDSKMDAKNGYLASFYIENSKKQIGSQIEYLKTLSEFRAIKTIDRFTGAFKIRLGTIDSAVPIFKHFYTGGASTNRGYKYRLLGDLDDEGNPYGGLTLVDTLYEIRYLTTKNLTLALFWDSSMLNDNPYSFKSKFYDSQGFGMRYKTIIGGIRLDIGFPEDENDFRINISIGEAF